MIVGVDNGLNGGLCAISAHAGDVILYAAMPTCLVGKKTETDVRAVKEWLLELNTDFVLAIEEPLHFARTSQAMRSMALSFGKLIGMSESCGYEVERIQVAEWQKKMLVKWGKGQTKQAALRVANKLKPDESWLATARSRVAHDGIVDAYLLAEFYRTNKTK